MKNTLGRFLLGAAFATALGLSIASDAAAQDRPCSDATLNGAFGYTNTGSITAAPEAGPFGGVGRQTFDGKGKTQAIATVSVNGNVISNVSIKGTYAVNVDCTGSMKLTVTAGTDVFTNSVYFVVVQGGAEIRAIQTDGGSVVTTIAKKQFPQ
jgi:hypothetical protein